MIRLFCTLLFLGVLLVLCPALETTAQVPVAVLKHDNSVFGDRLGFSIAVSDSVILAGAVNVEVPVAQAGAVFLFGNQNNQWSQIDSYSHSMFGATSGDHLGWDVAINSEYVFASAPFRPNQKDWGSVFIYPRTAANPRPPQMLDGPAIWSMFGWSIASTDSVLIVGTQTTDPQYGGIYVYENTDTSWVESLHIPPNEEDDFRLGRAVAITDSIIVGAAPAHKVNGVGIGAAYVYSYLEGVISSTQILLAEERSYHSNFGYAIAAASGWIAVSAERYPQETDRHGVVYMYEHRGDRYELAQTLLNPNVEDPRFGASIALAEKKLAISSGTGHAYVFKRQDAEWVLSGTVNDRAGDVAIDDRYLYLGYDVRESRVEVYDLEALITETESKNNEVTSAKNVDLASVYPNPLSATTTVSYSLAISGNVLIEVYNILGKRVRVLEHGFRAAGEHSVQLDATGLSTGVYFVRLSAGSNSQTRKFVVVR